MVELLFYKDSDSTTCFGGSGFVVVFWFLFQLLQLCRFGFLLVYRLEAGCFACYTVRICVKYFYVLVLVTTVHLVSFPSFLGGGFVRLGGY